MANQDIKPTRGELLNIRRRIRFAKQSQKVLKMKRDGLIVEFFQLLEEVRRLRENLVTLFNRAVKSMTAAEAIDGKMSILSAAFGRASDPEIKLGTRSVMGVVMPTVESVSIRTSIDKRGIGLIGPSIVLDRATADYEQLIEAILRAAEIETTIKRLITEIEKTKRRVNALEFNVIPNLNSTESFIRLRLEEMERENIFRLKRVKNRERVV